MMGDDASIDAVRTSVGAYVPAQQYPQTRRCYQSLLGPNETLLSVDVGPNETLLSMDLASNDTRVSMNLISNETLLLTTTDVSGNETLLSIVDVSAKEALLSTRQHILLLFIANKTLLSIDLGPKVRVLVRGQRVKTRHCYQ